jgi:thiosulfate dehydrogenase
MDIQKIIPRAILGVYLLFGHGFPACAALQGTADSASQAAAVSEEKSKKIRLGEYEAAVGDCIGCHSAPDGKSMSGGLEIKAPFGSIYASNIMPDGQTGIGKYSPEQFDRAVRRGVAPGGRNLYPAMPYPSYARMTAKDVSALYVYLIHGLEPVNRANKPAEMSWPFSIRWGLSFWNWTFLDSTPFQPERDRDGVWNRGAYLVQGPGHCGACHTPRGIAFQEKAMDQRGPKGRFYLAGETVDGWRALSLRNLWTVEDTVLLLKTGQNRFGSISGSMVEVIHYSTQHFRDDDLWAVATYLKSLSAGDEDSLVRGPAAENTGAGIPADFFSSRGGLGYSQFCADCHRRDGAGVKEIFPSLAWNPCAASSDPSTLLHVTLTGWKTAQTATYPRVYTMPAFSRLSDRELAEILSFVRGGWGNQAEPIPASRVKKMRRQVDTGTEDASGFVTPRLADLLSQPNAGQLIRGMRLHLETRALLPENSGNALNCTSCHLNAGTVAEGSPFTGVFAFFPGYAARAGRVITLEERINGCFLRSLNGKPLPLESADMKAMAAYFDWMKGEGGRADKAEYRGVGKIDTVFQPDVEIGRNVYSAQCAVCHGKDGGGLKQEDGRSIYPPLWGDDSFNIGAGMARTYTAAAFTKHNMPIGSCGKFPLGQGGLSDQDAVDVAEYFTHQPRPDFPAKVNDWPNGERPDDARY